MKKAPLWSGNRPDSDEEARDRLLDAFVTEMLARGYEKTTMSAVALRAGVTRPTLYKHFANITTLYRGAALRMFDDFTRRAGEHIGRYRSARRQFTEAALFAHRHMTKDSLFVAFLRSSQAVDSPEILERDEQQAIIDRVMHQCLDPIFERHPDLARRRPGLSDFIVRLTVSMVYMPFTDEDGVVRLVEDVLVKELAG
jgi:AcrR family transcriptional regulator